MPDEELLIGPPSQPFIVDPPPAPPPAAGGYPPEAYARQLESLLPRGLAWIVEPGSVMDRLLRGIAEELSRIDTRAEVLLLEADPRTAAETLDEWERVLGLPDECFADMPPTIDNRQRAITQRVVAQGGQTAAYYIELAESLGFSGAEVEDGSYGALRVGFGAGDRAYGDGWAYVWSMVLPASAPVDMRSSLECVIRRASPAHTLVLFSYV